MSGRLHTAGPSGRGVVAVLLALDLGAAGLLLATLRGGPRPVAGRIALPLPPVVPPDAAAVAPPPDDAGPTPGPARPTADRPAELSAPEPAESAVPPATPTDTGDADAAVQPPPVKPPPASGPPVLEPAPALPAGRDTPATSPEPPDRPPATRPRPPPTESASPATPAPDHGGNTADDRALGGAPPGGLRFTFPR